MTPLQFRAWRKRLGLDRNQAAAILGRSHHIVAQYSRSEGVVNHRRIPKPIEKLCWMIERHGPAPWPIDWDQAAHDKAMENMIEEELDQDGLTILRPEE